MILLTIYNDNYLWKNFYYNLFLFLPYPITAVYCFLSLLSSFPFHSLFLHFFAPTTSFLPLFYAFPPRYSFFQSVSRTFIIYLYIFIFVFSLFSYKSLFSYRYYIYISVYDSLYNKIPNIIYKFTYIYKHTSPVYKQIQT